MSILFIKDDIIELKDLIEISEGLTIDEIKINCFQELYKLAIGEVEVQSISESQAFEYLNQIKIMNDFFIESGFLESEVLKKLKKLLRR